MPTAGARARRRGPRADVPERHQVGPAAGADVAQVTVRSSRQKRRRLVRRSSGSARDGSPAIRSLPAAWRGARRRARSTMLSRALAPLQRMPTRDWDVTGLPHLAPQRNGLAGAGATAHRGHSSGARRGLRSRSASSRGATCERHAADGRLLAGSTGRRELLAIAPRSASPRGRRCTGPTRLHRRGLDARVDAVCVDRALCPIGSRDHERLHAPACARPLRRGGSRASPSACGERNHAPSCWPRRSPSSDPAARAPAYLERVSRRGSSPRRRRPGDGRVGAGFGARRASRCVGARLPMTSSAQWLRDGRRRRPPPAAAREPPRAVTRTPSRTPHGPRPQRPRTFALESTRARV